jgi:hypothetical protein
MHDQFIDFDLDKYKLFFLFVCKCMFVLKQHDNTKNLGIETTLKVAMYSTS